MKNILFISFLYTSLFFSNADAVNISNVFHGEVSNNTIEIRFNLSEKATTQVNIYDDRDYLIRSIVKGELGEGDNSVLWDLKDQNNITVPPEAYKYTIVSTGLDGVETIHDLSDLTGNKQVLISNPKILESGEIEFVLKKPSRVLIRAGLSGNGPLLITIANWIPRMDGLNRIHWDGYDASRAIKIMKHKKLYFNARAYTFSDNTIIVGKSNSSRFIDIQESNIKKREGTKVGKKKMIAAYQQFPETRGDFVVRLDVMHKSKEQNVVPIVSGVVPIKLSVDNSNMETVINRRAEPVFFIDGKFTYENEVGFYPMVWQLDTRNLNEGEHFLTVNLRGYEGNFGIASKKIIVKHNKSM